jgi:hypothetical protein
MIVRAGSGWQTVLADLSLILFMVTASAVNQAPVSAPPPPAVLPALGDPVALWRAEAGAPSLKDWLASAGPDPRLRLTIMAPAAEAEAALMLAAQAGRPARILIEPGATALIAALTYDQPPLLAQGLQPPLPKETKP